MERMEEEVPESSYRSYLHFISKSPWDYTGVNDQLEIDLNIVMQQEQKKNKTPTGYIIDESSHVKKGCHSAGVARQYAGSVGKVENCQVGVYACLCNGDRVSLLNERLFLPQSWIDDVQRCEQAEIPEDDRVYKTKPQLALEMIDKDIQRGVVFDWVGGDGLYGHNYELCKGLDQRHLLFVLDVHKDQHIYLEKPNLSIPSRNGNRGKHPTCLKADKNSLRADEYINTLKKSDWQKVKIRKTAKGWLRAWIHIKELWVWDGQEEIVRKRTLIIRKPIGKKNEIKYSLSNGVITDYSAKNFAYFQAGRYWVERSFDDAKNELGMSDYQVRKWLGWHHHHVMVMMAMLFLLRERIENEEKYPLMSVRDARLLLIEMIKEDQILLHKRWMQMNKRHQKRQADIDRFYNSS